MRNEEDPPPDQPGHPLAKMFLIGLVASGIGVAIALAIDWFPVNAASNTTEIDTLWDVLLIVSVPVFVLVMTVAIYSVIRFRARPGDMGDGAPIHGSTRLEIVWVLVPFVIVSILAGYAWVVLDDVEAKKPNELHVKVIGQQFAWHFQYPQYGNVQSDELYLPLDRPVAFDVTTKDVLHSFWIPSMRLKTDAVPGLTTHIRLTPSRIGNYDVVCAELCGLGHSTMRQTSHVIESQAFTDWVSKQKPAPDSGGGAGGTKGSSASSGESTIQPAG
ncbi:MAG: cytochrome c oxidase subunit [Thermoleophilaceae bacterium]|nr:cytochrome c oxidase subunit [Thermoleophilaceae bacterium]